MTATEITACPGCGTASAENYGGEGLCWACWSGQTNGNGALSREQLAELRWAEPLNASSWEPADLAPILAGEQHDQAPELLARADGVCLLYRERIHAGYAEPEAGKGWLALHAGIERLEAGETVIYVDYEDTAGNIVERLRLLGADDDAIRERFRYVRPDEPITDAARDALIGLSPALVVIDGLTEALAVEALDMANNQDVAEFYKRLARPFARAGAAVLLIDHVVKDREARGRYAIGAQHKLAGVDVAYRLDVAQPCGRGREGLVKITVTKDRPGFIREHAVDRERIAMMRLTSQPDGAVTVTLEPPEGAGSTFRPTVLMARVSRAVAESPGLSKRAIREAVSGRNTAKDLALELLVSEGYVDAKPDGQAVRHHSIRPFEEPDRAHRAQPCPDRAPGAGAHRAPPLTGGAGHGTRLATLTVPKNFSTTTPTSMRPRDRRPSQREHKMKARARVHHTPPIERGTMLRTDVLCRLLIERLNSLGPMSEAAAKDVLEQRQPGSAELVLRYGRSAGLIRRVQHDDEAATIEAIAVPRSMAA
jgi:hypothetical protein